MKLQDQPAEDSRKGDATFLSVQLCFDHRCSLKIIDSILDASRGSYSLLDKPSRLIVVPDNISANRLRDYIVQQASGSLLNDLIIITIEDLAKIVVGQSKSILDPELLKLVLFASVMNLDNPVAHKIKNTLSGQEEPEDSRLLEVLRDEFVEYSGFSSPKHRKKETMKKEITKVLDQLDPILERRALDVFEFYGILEDDCTRILRELEMDSFFLTRNHLVSQACLDLVDFEVNESMDLNEVREVHVIGVPVFDNIVLDFLFILSKKVGSLSISASEEISERFLSRLIARHGDDFFELTIVPRAENSDNVMIEAFKVPDKRREVELAAHKCVELIAKGAAPCDILIVSRLATDYEPYFQAIFQNFGLPTFLQTRVSIIFSPTYRFIESLVNLLVKIEEDQPIFPKDIATPLRLGFPTSIMKQSKEEWIPITDRRYLEIETELERIGEHSESAGFAEWCSIIDTEANGSTREKAFDIFRPIRQLLSWLSDTINSPVDFTPLIRIMGKYIAVYGVQQDHPLLGVIPMARFQLTDEHISAQATRILSGLHSLVRKEVIFAKARQILGLDKNHSTIWHDIRTAIMSGIGSMTYGRTYRDANAIQFVDAGISHFIETGHRIILGLTTSQFPRKKPEPFLLFPELRGLLDDPTKGYYLMSPDSHYEIEKYLFETAKSRSEFILYSMNYLDERGHEQHSSVFIKDVKLTRVAANDVFIEHSPVLEVNSTPNLDTVLSYRMKMRRGEINVDWEDALSDLFDSARKISSYEDELQAIVIRAQSLSQRVIGSAFDPKIHLGPQEMLNDVFDTKRDLSSWETDLLTYCPAMYYYYVFYHVSPNKDWIMKQGVDQFLKYIHSRKWSPRFGEIPPPVWRMHYSTFGSKWIEGKLKNKTSLTKDEIKNMMQEIDTLDTSFAEKTSFGHLLNFIGSLKRFEFTGVEKPEVFGFYCPVQVSFSRNWFLCKLMPNRRIFMTHLITSSMSVISPWNIDRYYTSFDDELPTWISLPDAEESLRNMHAYSVLLQNRSGLELPYSGDLCNSCPYRTLCGKWGF